MVAKIAILGSTGNIGKQTLEVISTHKELFEVEVLTAHTNADLLIKQALQYKPNAVVIGTDSLYGKVNDALSPHGIKVFAGEDSLEQIVEMETIDKVVMAVVGFAALKPTLNALLHGKDIALANKECLVAAGELVMETSNVSITCIIPIDSEQSAIYQCLIGEDCNRWESIVLTASGGPFYGKTKEELRHVTPEQALQHPKWVMGKKITVDSATLMNKGFEMIEATWLFDLSPSQIQVYIHPQSIIHGMITFEDGTVKALLSQPDMRLPIQYALSIFGRLANKKIKRLSLSDYASLTFAEPDMDTFRCLPLAYQALEKGGNIACSMNAANEIAVNAFLEKQLPFLQIADVIEETMNEISFMKNPNLNDLLDTDKESRRIAKTILTKLVR